MVFWIAVVVGAVFAWAAVQIGFYGAWIMFFNLVLSAYMAVFVTPIVIDSIPAATAIPNYGFALTTLSIAIATLFISYGICYAVLSGHLRAPFPNVFDNVGAGLLGFLSGFLVCSFAAFTFSLTPLSELDFSKSFGLDASSQTTNTAYVCWWCDTLHSFVSVRSSQPTRSSAAVATLLDKARPKPAAAPGNASAIEAVFGDAATAAPSEPGKAATPEGPAAAANPDGSQAPPTVQRTEGGDVAQPPPAAQNSVAQPPPAARNREGQPSTATPDSKAGAAAEQPRGQGKSWEEELGVSRTPTTAPPTKEPDAAPAARGASPPGTGRAAPPATPPATAANPLPVRQSPPPAAPPAAGEKLTPPDKAATAGAATSETPAPPPGPQGPLTGFWRATSGAAFRITDDGKTAVVKLWSSDFLQFMGGKLTRSEDKADAKTLTGSLDTVFFVDAPKRYPIKVTATIDDADQLSLKCADWPKRWVRGRVVERVMMPEILTRVEEPQPSPFSEPPRRPVVPDGAAAPPGK